MVTEIQVYEGQQIHSRPNDFRGEFQTNSVYKTKRAQIVIKILIHELNNDVFA